MLDVLLESRGVRTPRPLLEAILSAVAHGAIVVFILVGPSLGNHLDYADRKKDEITLPEYILPPDKSAPPQEEHLQFMAVGGIGSEHDDSGEAPSPEKESSAATREDRTVVALLRAQLVDNAYSVLDVDSAAVRDPSSAAPAYPPVMMSLAIEGAATIKFVVDTAGRVDLGTVQTLTATNPAFARAVLDAMPKMKFRPAYLGAVPVRQTASQEFKFQLKNLASGRP
jgi:protein TonB